MTQITLNHHGESQKLVVKGPTKRVPIGSDAYVSENTEDEGYVVDIVATDETIPFPSLPEALEFCTTHGIVPA